MYADKRLTEVFNKSKTLPFNDDSKIVLISDLHRGDGSWSDNFLRNQSIYFAALKQYYQNGYTYIELGDSDELWKNKSFSEINRIYSDIFLLLSRFHEEGRLHMICGNHDIEKLNPDFISEQMSRYFDSTQGIFMPLFKNASIHEGLILKHTECGLNIFLVHGHQGGLLDDRFWRINRFLVRHFVRKLELAGFNDITSAAKNNVKKRRVEKRIVRWAVKNNQMVIAGHTHRPVCHPDADSLYYNDGSAVHPNCISCIEIADGELSLYKWSVKTRADGSLYVGKDLIAARRELTANRESSEK